jgi:hypothetical protein
MPRLLRLILTAVAALAVFYAVATVWRQNDRAAGLDFYIYFVAGQLAGRADVENIYAAEVQERVGEEYFERARQSGSERRRYDAQRRRRLDLVSSPFLFSTLRWTSRDYDRALTQLHAFVLFAFIAGVLLLCRAVRLPWAGSLFLVAGLLLWYRGFEADLRVGNVNSMQLLALAVVVWGAGRRGAGGTAGWEPALRWVLLGALLMFKPNVMFVPLLFAVARLARREYRALGRDLVAGSVGAFAAIAIASITYGSPRVWLQWVRAANDFYHRLPTRVERNVTPALALFHEHGEWVSYALAALLLAIVCAAIWRTKSDDAPLLAGLGILVYLLSANVVWLHYMVLAIPIAVALMRWRTTAVISIAALLLIAEEPFEMLAGRAAFEVEAWLIGPALFVLFGCGVWALGRTDRPAGGPSSFLHRDPATVRGRLARGVEHALLHQAILERCRGSERVAIAAVDCGQECTAEVEGAGAEGAAGRVAGTLLERASGQALERRAVHRQQHLLAREAHRPFLAVDGEHARFVGSGGDDAEVHHRDRAAAQPQIDRREIV